MIGASRLLMIGSEHKGLERGMKEGMKQCIEHGQRDERLKNARGMKSKGIPSDVISEITGLSVGEVESL